MDPRRFWRLLEHGLDLQRGDVEQAELDEAKRWIDKLSRATRFKMLLRSLDLWNPQ